MSFFFAILVTRLDLAPQPAEEAGAIPGGFSMVGLKSPPQLCKRMVQETRFWLEL
jgi:hypothetical protein